MASCPSCRNELPAGDFPFCPFCTAPLTEHPAALLQEERKVVSVLFCDLVGFTAASETADPEDVRARLRPYHHRLRGVIEAHGGTVEKFVGDAVMAAFGAPVAHEDDAERAVRAALAILEAIEALNEEDPSRALHVRIGINTGEAVVSLDARVMEGEGFVTGDVVNTASRLQGAAPVNGVVVSEQTFRETERVFVYEPLEAAAVKGKTASLAIYRPLRARARFGADVARAQTTPLVGRDLERTLVVSTFERAAQQRSCQLLTVVGEPGVGKSRLCVELFQYVDAQPGLVTWRQGRCLPYGEGIAFWALGEVVKAECGILDSDSPDEARVKLERAIPETEQDRPWLLARLGPLVGLAGEPAAQEESFTAWRRFLEGLAARRPTVLVFEDLHWADPALLAFLEHLADWVQGVPLLLLCTARPELYEQHSPFGARARNGQRINLAPLNDQETAQLVAALLDRAVLPAETQRQLLERAGGNPLYAEEFVRLLVDRGELGEEVELPGSVQALIAARLDTLTPERKGLLQDASALGKVFWSGALAAMGERDLADAEQALHELSRKELVRPSRTSSMEGEAEYGFWHALVRDVAYSQIPRAGRASRHQAAAAWIEARAGERVEDLADVLAYHYETALELSRAAGQTEQIGELEAAAFRYLLLAGERTLGLDTEQAEQTLARALKICPAGHPGRARALEYWAEALRHQSRLQEARAALEEALDLHRARGDTLAAGRTLTQLSLVFAWLGEPAAELVREALELLETLPPGAELVTAYSRQAGLHAVAAAFLEAITAADQAIDLAKRLGLPEPARAHATRGLARASLGDRDGLEEMRRGLKLAIDQGEGDLAAAFYSNLAFAVGLYEGPQAELDLFAEGIDFSRRRGLENAAEGMAGIQSDCIALAGHTERALVQAAETAERLEAAGSVAFIASRSLQVRLLTEQGSSAQAPDPEPLLAVARKSGDPQRLAEAIAGAAPLYEARGDHEQAAILLAELDRMPGTRGDSVYAGELPRFVRTCLALGDRELAASLLHGVQPLYPRADHSLASCHAQLAEAEGNHEEAARLYADAANRWQAFGTVPEHAYALLGQGRSLRALGDSAAEAALAEARELFMAIGYRAVLAETDALLAESQSAAS